MSYLVKIKPAMYGLNVASSDARVFMVAMPIALLFGFRESAMIAEVGGKWKTRKPWTRAPSANHSQLGAKT
ncbi:hypothetical protein ES703_58032 [subsurface metagenome]